MILRDINGNTRPLADYLEMPTEEIKVVAENANTTVEKLTSMIRGSVARQKDLEEKDRNNQAIQKQYEIIFGTYTRFPISSESTFPNVEQALLEIEKISNKFFRNETSVEENDFDKAIRTIAVQVLKNFISNDPDFPTKEIYIQERHTIHEVRKEIGRTNIYLLINAIPKLGGLFDDIKTAIEISRRDFKKPKLDAKCAAEVYGTFPSPAGWNRRSTIQTNGRRKTMSEY